MNFEGQMLQLRRMTAEVEMETAKLSAGGKHPEPGSRVHSEIVQKIEEWQRRAELIRRQLKSSESLADLQYRAHRFGPAGYSARQRRDSRLRNIDEQRAAVRRFARAVVRLAAKLHGPQGPGHARLKGLSDALKKITDALDSDETLSPSDVQRVTSETREAGWPDAPPLQFTPGMVSGLLTLTVYVFVMIKHKLDNRDGGVDREP